MAKDLLRGSIIVLLVSLAGELLSVLFCDGIELELIGMSDEDILQMFLLGLVIPMGITIGTVAIIALGIYIDNIIFNREVRFND